MKKSQSYAEINCMTNNIEESRVSPVSFAKVMDAFMFDCVAVETKKTKFEQPNTPCVDIKPVPINAAPRLLSNK